MGRFVVPELCGMVERGLLLPKVVVWFAVMPQWDLGLNVTSAKTFARLEREFVVSQHTCESRDQRCM